jgi:hypothetical protein
MRIPQPWYQKQNKTCLYPGEAGQTGQESSQGPQEISQANAAWDSAKRLHRPAATCGLVEAY